MFSCKDNANCFANTSNYDRRTDPKTTQVFNTNSTLINKYFTTFVTCTIYNTYVANSIHGQLCNVSYFIPNSNV